jgi:imidazolonepropionase-like amidohydrolase
MKNPRIKVFLMLILAWLPVQQCLSQQTTLFTNVRVFDGSSDQLQSGMSVLINGNLIQHMSKGQIDSSPDTTVIDGNNRVLMPGLIDAHWHVFMAPVSFEELANASDGYLYTMAALEAGSTLMRGFTTIRDVSGPVFGIKRAIDEGAINGPRIYPSGSGISQTSGHGDTRSRPEIPRRFGGTRSRLERIGLFSIADGEAEVLTAVREQLRLGASQIKVFGGGGVGSLFDPLDSVQFTSTELRAAVQAASDWGTYVTAHIYTPTAIRRAVEAGVRCIEHGHLIDEPTMKLLAENGIWLSMQPFVYREDLGRPRTEAQVEKYRKVTGGTQNAYRLAKKHGVKLAFGTDLLFSRETAAGQNKELLTLLEWFTPAEILKMATSTNGELMALSGPRNPYPKKLGVIEAGAYADLLLVNGNPLQDLAVLADPENNIDVIMKDGYIYKNQ